MRIAAFSVLFAFVVLAAPAWAADAPAYNPKVEQLMDINRISPLQNPKYDRAHEVLGRRILDRKSKVVGSIQDVVLNENGGIMFLDVKFDRIQLGRAVFVNYSGFNMEPVTNGYAMTFDASEIENVYPQMLADISTAAGAEDDTHSLKKMQGLAVKTPGGRQIGKVEDVLFGGNGERAEAVYVGMTTGTLRGRSVAVPFSDAKIAETNGARSIVVADDIADAMIDIAKDK